MGKKKFAQKSVNSHVGKTGLGRPRINAISAYGSEQMRKIKRKLNANKNTCSTKYCGFEFAILLSTLHLSMRCPSTSTSDLFNDKSKLTGHKSRTLKKIPKYFALEFKKKKIINFVASLREKSLVEWIATKLLSKFAFIKICKSLLSLCDFPQTGPT